MNNSKISTEMRYAHQQEILIGDTRLAIHERDDTQDPVTGHALTGSWLWDSALYLSKWMSEAIDAGLVRISGATVLELGAGTGLPGLFAAAKGASRVVLTDVGSLVPSLCTNVAANGLEHSVQVMELKWGQDASMLGPVEIDVVLLSDLFYDPEEMPALARTLNSVWTDQQTKGYAASEIREGVKECLKVLQQEGFEFHDVALTMSQLALRVRDSAEIAVFAVFEVSRVDCAVLN